VSSTGCRIWRVRNAAKFYASLCCRFSWLHAEMCSTCFTHVHVYVQHTNNIHALVRAHTTLLLCIAHCSTELPQRSARRAWGSSSAFSINSSFGIGRRSVGGAAGDTRLGQLFGDASSLTPIPSVSPHDAAAGQHHHQQHRQGVPASAGVSCSSAV
jgi:hypothetical protein